MGHTGEAEQIIEEEAEHVERQEQASEAGDAEQMVEETTQHAEDQVRHAVMIQNYEEILDVTLQHGSLEELLPEMLTRLRGMMRMEATNAFLLEPGDDVLRVVASAGMEESVRRQVQVPIGSGFIGRVAAERRPLELYQVDAKHVVNPLLVERGIQSMAGVPIMAGNQLVGVLEGVRTGREKFEKDELRLLELVAQRTGLAIERARLMHRLEQARQRAEQNSQMKTTLVQMLTHDVRTPLSAISSMVQVLESGRISPEQQVEFLRRVRHGIGRLDLLISDFLDLVRLEAQRPKPETRDMPIQPMVQEIIELFSAQASGADVRVTSQVPDIEASINPRRMRQVLANLVSNAIKHAGPGAEAVVEAEQKDDFLILRVRDDGRGIDPERLATVGTEFSEGAEGTGLGLYLSRLLVQEQGGELLINSEGEGGVTVEIRLPG